MKKLFLLLLTAFLCIGCSSDDETIHDYVGTWSGTFEGGDKGVWNFVVDNTGKVVGTMHSETTTDNYSISGSVSNSGDLTGTLGLPAKGEFKGKLTIDKTVKNGNGSWGNTLHTPAQYGTWKGTKK